MNFINEKILKIFNNVDFWIKLLEKTLLIIVIIIVATIGVKILNKIIDYIMTTRDNANKKFNIKFNEKRSETLHKLVKSAVRYTVYFIAFFQILATVGVNTTSIVASAGRPTSLPHVPQYYPYINFSDTYIPTIICSHEDKEDLEATVPSLQESTEDRELAG